MTRSRPPDPGVPSPHDQGIAHFQAGRFHEAHESWEGPWRAARGTEREFLQGLIQIAAACLHSRAGRPSPARRLFARAGERLRAGGPSAPFGFPLEDLLARLSAAPAALLDSPSPPDPSVYFPLHRSESEA